MASLVIGGERVALRVTWGHVATFRGLYGVEFEAAIQEALSTLDMERVAEILAVITGRPASDWMRESPPIVAAVSSVASALTEAFNGPGEKRKAPAAEAAGGNAPFVMRIRRSLALWLGRFAHGLRPAATPVNSGL